MTEPNRDLDIGYHLDSHGLRGEGSPTIPKLTHEVAKEIGGHLRSSLLVHPELQDLRKVVKLPFVPWDRLYGKSPVSPKLVDNGLYFVLGQLRKPMFRVLGLTSRDFVPLILAS